MSELFFSKLTFKSIFVLFFSILLFFLVISSFIITQQPSASNSDKKILTDFNICNGIIILIFLIMISFGVWLIKPENNENEKLHFMFITIGLILLSLSIVQIIFISNVSINFDSSIQESLYICAGIILLIGFIFMIYGIYLYILKEFQSIQKKLDNSAKKEEEEPSVDFLLKLQKDFDKKNKFAEEMLRKYGVNSEKYTDAKRDVENIVREIEIFENQSNEVQRRMTKVTGSINSIRTGGR
jgi:hypothetical protein